MKFRFTLNNTIEGSHQISEPDGWKNIFIKLERSEEFHSLIELIDTPFFFYNIGQGKDGGREYLYNIEQTQGINAIVSLMVELTEDGTNYDTVYQANIDLSTISDISSGDKFYRFSCTLKPTDLWAMFLNRRSTKVDLNATTDLDDGAVAAPDAIALELLSQIIRGSFTASENLTGIEFVVPAASYLQFAFDTVVLDEIETRFNIPISDTSDPAPTFTVKYPGTYRFQIVMTITQETDPAGVDAMANLSSTGLLFKVRQTRAGINTEYSATRTDHINASATAGYSKYTIDVTINAEANDDLAFFFQTTTTGFDPTDITPTGRFLIFLGDNNAISSDARIRDIHDTSTIVVTANTIYPQTRSDAFLIHEAASAIVKRIAPGFDIYSDYFGGSLQGYGANGCGYLYALLLGLHVRGYTFPEKPFSISFNEWWTGANPIFNLGIGPETVGGNEVLRIEPKDHFYDDDPILYFDNVQGMERSYDPAMIFKSIKHGYGNSSVEAASGIDDPQTVHDYSTLLKIIGVEFSNLSSWFAASLGIEQTRRNRAEKGKDWRLDNEIIVISVDKTPSASPEFFMPEVGSPFTSITGLLNPTSRYNIRITPYRNFVRWVRFYSGCLQKYLSSVFRFNQGEGNYDMAVGANSDTCDNGTWSERQDIAPSGSPYFTPEMANLPSVVLTWPDYQLLTANRKRCIAASKGTTGHTKIHIKSLKYDIAHARATIKGWVKPDLMFTFSGAISTIIASNSWNLSFNYPSGSFNKNVIYPSVSEFTESKAGLVSDTSLTITVRKDSNGGIVQNNGNVDIYRNGVFIIGLPFLVGQNRGTSPLVHTMTVAIGDVILSAVDEL